ncbi:MAG: ACT domain-containing protein [Muribaculaceae bacterium]
MTTDQTLLFTIIIYSENSVGLLNRVSNIFTRRCINIETVNAGRSGVDGVHKLAITTWVDRPTIERVASQIEKIVEVVKVYIYSDAEIIANK